MVTLEQLIADYVEFDGSRVAGTHIEGFRAWLRKIGYECHIKRTREAAELERSTLTAQRDALDERIAELDKELQQ